jgi:hypothetical protein
MLQFDFPYLLLFKPLAFPDICIELYFVHYLVFVADAMQILDDFWARWMEGRPFWIWAEGKRVEDSGAVKKFVSV